MSRQGLVILTLGIALVVFGAASLLFTKDTAQKPSGVPAESTVLVRPSSPVIGPVDAPVTIVEFFDPACETCRAFFPTVKKILADNPRMVRLVIRYAALHDVSEEAIRILEAARKQGVFEPVLQALIDTQPVWASHSAPDMTRAWSAAREAGLDEARARREMAAPEIAAILAQDSADLRAAGVRGTPTFFVNGKPLPSFGRQQLVDLVRGEVQARQ